jgi:hypothetical protein
VRSSTVKGSVVRVARRMLWCALGPVACVPATRNEPSLEQKCRDLVEYCENVPSARRDLRDCYDVGRRGVREPENRDQCFLAWDECIDECQYLAERLSDAPDGG